MDQALKLTPEQAAAVAAAKPMTKQPKEATAPAVDAMTGKTTITLQYPTTLPDHRVISALTMRRPKVNDLRAAQRQAQTDADREVTLVAMLTDEKLTPEDIGELDLADYAQVQATFRGFQGL